MRVRKMTALMLAGAMTASMGTFAFADEANELPTIDSIKLGEDYTDLTASIKVLTHRTDIVDTIFSVRNVGIDSFVKYDISVLIELCDIDVVPDNHVFLAPVE